MSDTSKDTLPVRDTEGYKPKKMKERDIKKGLKVAGAVGLATVALGGAAHEVNASTPDDFVQDPKSAQTRIVTANDLSTLRNKHDLVFNDKHEQSDSPEQTGRVEPQPPVLIAIEIASLRQNGLPVFDREGSDALNNHDYDKIKESITSSLVTLTEFRKDPKNIGWTFSGGADFTAVVMANIETFSSNATDATPAAPGSDEERVPVLLKNATAGFLITSSKEVYAYDTAEMLTAAGLTVEPAESHVFFAGPEQLAFADLTGTVYATGSLFDGKIGWKKAEETATVPEVAPGITQVPEPQEKIETPVISEVPVDQNVINMESYNGLPWPDENMRVNLTDKIEYVGVDQNVTKGSIRITDKDGKIREYNLSTNGVFDQIGVEDYGTDRDISVRGTFLGVLGTRTVQNLETLNPSTNERVDFLSFDQIEVIDIMMAVQIDGKQTNIVVSLPKEQVFSSGIGDQPKVMNTAEVLDLLQPGVKTSVSLWLPNGSWSDFLANTALQFVKSESKPPIKYKFALINASINQFTNNLEAFLVNQTNGTVYVGPTHELEPMAAKPQ